MDQKMLRSITLSSYAAKKGRESNFPSDFVTQFEEPLVLDKNRQYAFGLSQINSMTYSWYNISEFYGNKKIKYSLDSGRTFKELTFANGNYSYGDMSSYIAEFLAVNDNVEVSPIKLDFDLTSFKVLITLDANTQLDLRDGNFADLIGFDKKIVQETEYGSKLPNITNSIDSIYIHCDLITDSVVDGKSGDVIYVFSTANLTRSYPFERTPYHIGFSRVNKTRIDSIRVWLTDADGRNIDLNGVDTSFTFILREI